MRYVKIDCDSGEILERFNDRASAVRSAMTDVREKRHVAIVDDVDDYVLLGSRSGCVWCDPDACRTLKLEP